MTHPGPASFRVATPDDVPAIVALVESAYRGDASRVGWTTEADLLDGQRTDADAVRDIVRSDDGLLLLAVDPAGQLLACCQLERRSDGVAYFGQFAVRPELQGSGVGRTVLAEAERLTAAEWGATVMEMTVIAQREDLIAWYERRGYSRTGDFKPFPYDDERFGLPRVPDLRFAVLSKSLRSS